MKRPLGLSLFVIFVTGCGHLGLGRKHETQMSLRTLAPAVPTPPGYKACPAPAYFRRDTLYEAIDGQDGEFMGYGCTGMARLEWPKAGSGDDKIQAEIYDMGTPLGAFGIYSRAHTGKGEFADLGEEAAVSEDAVEFARERFYFRLMGPPDARSQLESIGKAIVAKVPPGPTVTKLTAALPAEGRVPRSERWIPDTAFGMEFMKNVFVARYQLSDKTVELYVAACAHSSAAATALGKFREAVKARSPQGVSGSFPGFAYSDEWMGRIAVFQLDRRLAVVVGFDPSLPVEALLQKVLVIGKASSN